ncbi:MAG: DUF58 domain-containing protein [Lentisphaeria bacterium]|nr:DUF58 domain-containing protein [Lentisphaeria bacterium]
MQTRELIARVRKIEIRTRKTVEDIIGGAYHSMFKGRGIEFSEVRAYAPEDDVRDIDWNVTARTGTAHIKKYVEERELTVLLAVDVSSSMRFGSGEETKAETAASAAALLAFSAIRNHDKVGLILFSDKIEFFLPPRAGRRHVLRILRELVAREPEPNRKTDLACPLEFISRAQKKRAVVFLIGDFAESGDFERSLKLLNRKHDAAVFRVHDPFEEKLALARMHLNLRDSETGRLFSAGAPSAKYAAAQLSLRKKTEETFRRIGVDMVDLTTGEDIVRPLIGFFRSRRHHRGRS